MHSLQSYKQGEPAYDNNAFAVTSIYHGGTLKMYTSHTAQLNRAGSRPKYYSFQIQGIIQFICRFALFKRCVL